MAKERRNKKIGGINKIIFLYYLHSSLIMFIGIMFRYLQSEITKFFNDTPNDHTNHPIKMTLILALNGFLRKSEIVSIMMSS